CKLPSPSILDFNKLISIFNFSISLFVFVLESEAISIPVSTFSTTFLTLSSTHVISTSHSLYFNFILVSKDNFDTASLMFGNCIHFLSDKDVVAHHAHHEQHLLVSYCC